MLNQPTVASSALLLGLWLSLASPGSGSVADSLDGHSRFEFASATQAKTILQANDRFVSAMSPMDRRLRLRSADDVSPQTFLEFVGLQALDFTQDEMSVVRQVVVTLQPRLRRFRGHWPELVRFVKTTGLEEGQAPHCRGNNIVLPQRLLSQPDALRTIVVHELFHILSRQSEAQRAKLYSIVGFESCQPIALPNELRGRKITNPDAPEIDCVMALEHQGEQRYVTPILLSRQASYKTFENKNLFSEIDFRLMPVTLTSENLWQAEDSLDPRQLWTPRQLPKFHEKIGRNTNYIIHPEEILAANFELLVLGAKDPPDPWVLEKMSEVLETLPESDSK